MSEEQPERNTSYAGLFVIGISFMGAGAAFMTTNTAMIGLFAVGIAFMIIGLANRDKWQTTQ